jgi:hypothetical protein
VLLAGEYLLLALVAGHVFEVVLFFVTFSNSRLMEVVHYGLQREGLLVAVTLLLLVVQHSVVVVVIAAAARLKTISRNEWLRYLHNYMLLEGGRRGSRAERSKHLPYFKIFFATVLGPWIEHWYKKMGGERNVHILANLEET